MSAKRRRLTVGLAYGRPPPPGECSFPSVARNLLAGERAGGHCRAERKRLLHQVLGGSSVSCSGFDSRHGSGPARFRTLALLPFSFPGWAEEASVISGDDPLLRVRVQLPIRTSSLVQPPLQMSSSSQDFPLPAGGQWCNSTHLLHAPVSQSGRGPCLRCMSVPVRVRPGVPAPSAGPAGWASQPLGISLPGVRADRPGFPGDTGSIPAAHPCITSLPRGNRMTATLPIPVPAQPLQLKNIRRAGQEWRPPFLWRNLPAGPGASSADALRPRPHAGPHGAQR